MKFILRFSLFILLTPLLAGCDLQGTFNELRGNQATPTQPGVFFYDEFNSIFSGWDSEKGDDGQAGYVSGGYLIWVKQPNLDLWATPGLDLGDVSIEVDAARVNGPESNTYGVICRYTNTDNYYFGIIGSDGFYGIGKRSEGQDTLLNDTRLQPTDKVASGSTVNHLRFDCVGSTLALYVNGYLLAQTQDADFIHGDVGVIAGTLDEAGVAVTFDNFAVFNPATQ